MSDNSRAIVPAGQRGIVVSVTRQIAITEKLLKRIQSVQALLDVFYVPQDGSFEDAIRRIRPGGLISIAEGRFVLDAQITITKPLRINGAGQELTIIVSSVEGTILCVDTDGLFSLENVGILRTGEECGELLWISAGEVVVKSCALAGSQIENDPLVVGIWIDGSTVGVVEDTSVTSCNVGILVLENSAIKLHHNRCEKNECGIFFGDSAIGTIENNICSQNTMEGIQVLDQSKVDLIGNRCESNTRFGISFSDSATGTAERNICKRNLVGIHIKDSAKVELINNCCEENEEDGDLPALAELVKELPKRNTPALKTEQTTSTEWFNKAFELKDGEDWPGLLNHALRWTQAQPENADAWCFLGIAYMQSDQLAKAIEASQQAICIKPEDADLWCSLGIFYKVSGQTAKAIEAYQQAIRINPEDANAWYRLGIAYNSSGQASQIIEVHKSLKSLDPAMADEFFNKFVSP